MRGEGWEARGVRRGEGAHTDLSRLELALERRDLQRCLLDLFSPPTDMLPQLQAFLLVAIIVPQRARCQP